MGLALVSRLQDLIHHLHDDQVRRQLNAALLHSFGTELCANEEPSADESAAKLVAAATAAARRLLLSGVGSGQQASPTHPGCRIHMDFFG